MKSKQNLEIKLIQKNEISYRQMYSLKILSMNLVELDEFLKSEEEENPFLELSDFEMPNINSYITYPENNSQYIEIENKIKENKRLVRKSDSFRRVFLSCRKKYTLRMMYV